MSSNLLIPVPRVLPDVAARPVDITTFSYEDRNVILPAVTEALEQSGCWLQQRHVTSLTQVEFHFEVYLRGVIDLYAGLIAAGLELTCASHNDLTALCTVRQHGHFIRRFGLVAARLEISFMKDAESGTLMATTVACA